MKQQALQHLAMAIVGFTVIVLVTACGTTTTNSTNISGMITSVSAAHHSVTLNVNDLSGSSHTVTIVGLTDQQVAQLQGQIGKYVSIVVLAMQNSDGSYTLATNVGGNIAFPTVVPTVVLVQPH